MIPIRIVSNDGTILGTQLQLVDGTPIPGVSHIALTMGVDKADGNQSWTAQLTFQRAMVNIERASAPMHEFLVSAISTVPRAELETMYTAIKERLSGLDPVCIEDMNANILCDAGMRHIEELIAAAEEDGNDLSADDSISEILAAVRLRIEARELPGHESTLAEAERKCKAALMRLETPEGIEKTKRKAQLHLQAIQMVRDATMPEKKTTVPGVLSGALAGAVSTAEALDESGLSAETEKLLEELNALRKDDGFQSIVAEGRKILAETGDVQKMAEFFVKTYQNPDAVEAARKRIEEDRKIQETQREILERHESGDRKD